MALERGGAGMRTHLEEAEAENGLGLWVLCGRPQLKCRQTLRRSRTDS